MATPYDRLLKEEEATRRRLRQVLEEARRTMRRRLMRFEPEEHAAVVLTAMLQTVEAALAKVNRSLGETLDAAAARAADLGVAGAQADLPEWIRQTPFDLPEDLLVEAGRVRAERIVGITDTMRAQIARQVQIGILAGEPIEEIARGIGATGIQPTGLFQTAEARADAIAVTELHGMYNRAAYEGYRDAASRIPGLEKEWVTAEDDRVRPSHAALSGARIPFEQHFSVGGVNARGPHDPALPARQVVRCRCRIIVWPPEPEEE